MAIRPSPPVKTKIFYGFGAIAYSLPHQIIASFFLFYVTVILHIPPITAGIIMSISLIWDALTDPLIGHVSDKTQSVRFGRRHLYLIIGGVGTAIGTMFLWSISPHESELYKITMLLIWILFTKIMLTFYGAPYFAIGGSMSNDHDESTSIQSYRASFHVVGIAIATVGSTVVLFNSTAQYPKGQFNPEAYPLMGFSAALISLIVALIAIILIPKDRGEFSPSVPLPPKTNIITLILGSLKNTNFRALFLLIFLIEVAFQVSLSIGFHVSTYTYNLTGPQIGLLGLTILVFSILSQPFWVSLSRKFEKKTALIAGMFFGIIGFAGLPLTFIGFEWLPLNQPQTLPFMLVFSVLSGLGNGAFMSIPFSMVADTIDQNEESTGLHQEGFYFGLYNFSYKAGISISVLIGGILLETIGFDSSLTQQSVETSYYLAMIPAWLLILFFPAMYLVISKYQLNRKSHQDILANTGK